MTVNITLDTEDPLNGKLVLTFPDGKMGKLTIDEARQWIKAMQDGIELLENLKDAKLRLIKFLEKKSNET